MNLRRTMFRCVVLPLALACVVVVAAVAEACPNCKEAVAQNDSDQMRIARGYFWSILFMMSMPFAIVGSFGTYVFIQSRKARNADSGPGSSQVSSETK